MCSAEITIRTRNLHGGRPRVRARSTVTKAVTATATVTQNGRRPHGASPRPLHAADQLGEHADTRSARSCAATISGLRELVDLLDETRCKRAHNRLSAGTPLSSTSAVVRVRSA